MIVDSGKISIIIPVYNCKGNLKNCINSILCQSYTHIEIIMIDDGSTDGSGKLCDEIASCDDRISVIHQVNGGAGSARNAGIDFSTGEYLYFCDGDDLLLPGTLSKMAELIKKYHADMCIGGYTRKLKYVEDAPNVVLQNRNNAMELISMNESYGGFIWNKMFLKRKVGNLRFDPAVKFCEDQLFCLKYMEKSEKFVFTSSKVYFYRDNPEGTCNNCNIYHLLDFTFAIYECALILQRNSVNTQTVRYMMDRVQQMSVRIFIDTFKIKKDRSLLQKKLIYVFGKARQYHKVKVDGVMRKIKMKILCLLFKLGWT